jgi:RNA-directed DNA polymerase
MSGTEMPGRNPGAVGRNPIDHGLGAPNIAAGRDQGCRDSQALMEALVERGNMTAAYKRVVGNKGVAGADGMSVNELKPYLDAQWERIKMELLTDRYHPKAVLEVEIPKPNGGMRKLGIPTVCDRLIGQALYQVMKPCFVPHFSAYSFGFMEGRSAQQAVLCAREYVTEGYNWVVDIDLEKFFDRVNHDKLMSLAARKIADKRVLRLIRRYLQAGIMIDGVVSQRTEGTPQGSPLSPLLSNILLDELDKELERRNHKFVRYADDCNIYVRSEAAARRVMKSITEFLSSKLRLRVNQQKSKIGRPWTVKFLGYTFGEHDTSRVMPAEQSWQRVKAKLQEEFRKGRGRSQKQLTEELNKILRGWANYFKLTGVNRRVAKFDGWVRRKLRCIIWRQWKTPKTRERNLVQRGLFKDKARKYAGNGRGPWFNAGASHMNFALPKEYFKQNGLVSMFDIIAGNP